MKTILLAILLAVGLSLAAAGQRYTANGNAHSHNDYLQARPFHVAHAHRFASIEVDIHLAGDRLLVAHDAAGLDTARTLERLYLRPLAEQVDLNGGTPYPGGGTLQLLVDIKTDGDATLRRLEEVIRPFRRYFDPAVNPAATRLVISGNAPPPGRFADYDPLFLFDGDPFARYTPAQAARVPLYSLPLARFSGWNGLGRLPAPEHAAITSFVDSLHRAGKKVRFWGTPDTKTLWQAFIKIGVDYINTDRPGELAAFLRDREKHGYRPVAPPHVPRRPAYRADGRDRAPRNVILLISDGAGFAHLWAAATANRGDLNVMQCKHTGFLITTSFDDYNTDSAAAGTAIATGTATRNRYIGVDPGGRPVPNLVELLSARGVACGVITNDNITGATPAAFLAHRVERGMSDSIARDIIASPAALVVGGAPRAFGDEATLRAARAAGFRVTANPADLATIPAGERVIALGRDTVAAGYRIIEEVFPRAARRLAAGKGGFFLMVEGARVDAGGHANDLSLVIDEYLSFDRLVGMALAFADENDDTLVIITSDHETGGLVPLDGDYATGVHLADFATVDHTGAPVPLFAYGPGAAAFHGFTRNSELAGKILRLVNGKK
ncbi:MAG: alkaline phosphatase [Odoribacteraceae bacterium]|nr:alkaline phosphatase [Odoribacteraceae bacterium]